MTAEATHGGIRAIVLGGAGDMGSRAVRDLAAAEDVARIAIADANLERAAALAAELGPRAVAVRVNANDPAALAAVIRGHDVAASAIGPFYLYEGRCAAAAIDARVPYVSICDDHDGTRAALALDERARAAGVPVLTGLGWTPGLSNVLARRAADRLADVERIDVAWGGSASDSEGFAVILHTIHIFSGTVPSFEDGREVQVPAGSGRRRVTFPPPVGETDVYHVGHPEPLTLPRSIRCRAVSLRGGLSERPLNTFAVWLARARLTDTPRKKQRVGRMIKWALPLLSRLGKPAQPCSAIRVDVTGRDRRTVSYGAAGHMADLTGVPLAVGARMLARGEIAGAGVLTPEECVPVEPFLAALAERGIEVVEMPAAAGRAEPAPAGAPAV